MVGATPAVASGTSRWDATSAYRLSASAVEATTHAGVGLSTAATSSSDASSETTGSTTALARTLGRCCGGGSLLGGGRRGTAETRTVVTGGADISIPVSVSMSVATSTSGEMPFTSAAALTVGPVISSAARVPLETPTPPNPLSSRCCCGALKRTVSIATVAFSPWFASAVLAGSTDHPSTDDASTGSAGSPPPPLVRFFHPHEWKIASGSG